jgi:hypothetical protein
MKNLTKFILGFTAAALLAACGSGSSSNQNPTTEGKTQFQMTNLGAYDLARVDIVTNDGVLQSSRSIQCAATSDCRFKADMEKPGDLLFFDKNGTLVSAYILTEAPTERAYVRTSRRMMGIYVFDQLRKRYPQSADLLAAKLAIFFTNYDSPDQLPDDFQELGMYYQYRMAGTGLTTDEFYTALNKRLENSEVLESQLYAMIGSRVFNTLLASLPNVNVVSPAYAAGDGKCPAGFTSAMTIVSGIGDFMIGDGFIPVFGIANELIKDACDDTTERLDKIQDSINQLYAQLAKTDAKIDDLIDFVSATEARTILRQMKLHQETLRNSYINAYIELVNTTTSKSLKEVVQKQGGLEKAFAKSTNLQDVLKLADQWTLLNTGIGDADKTTFVTALNNQCAGSSDSSSRDLLRNRTNCNLLISYYKMIVTSTHGSYLTMLKDITDTIQSYQASEGSWIALNIKKPGNEVKSNWADQYTYVLKPALQANMAKLETGFARGSEQGYFKLTEGLPQALLDNLVRIDCKNGTGSANLTEWIKNGTDKSYVTVRCQNRGPTLSRYYYAKDGNDVTNLLGVVIPSNRPSGTAAEHEFENFNTWYIPESWPTYTGTFTRGTVVKQNEGNDKIRKTTYPGSGYIPYSISESNWSSSDRANPTSMYVLYTEPKAQRSDPLSYVWGVAYWRNHSISYGGVSAAMMCMTSNCTYTGDYRVTFKEFDGPGSIWHGMTHSESHNSASVAYELSGQLYAPKTNW